MLINSIASYIDIHVHTIMLLAKQKYLGYKIVQGQSEFAIFYCTIAAYDKNFDIWLRVLY